MLTTCKTRLHYMFTTCKLVCTTCLPHANSFAPHMFTTCRQVYTTRLLHVSLSALHDYKMWTRLHCMFTTCKLVHTSCIITNYACTIGDKVERDHFQFVWNSYFIFIFIYGLKIIQHLYYAKNSICHYVCVCNVFFNRYTYMF